MQWWKIFNFWSSLHRPHLQWHAVIVFHASLLSSFSSKVKILAVVQQHFFFRLDERELLAASRTVSETCACISRACWSFFAFRTSRVIAENICAKIHLMQSDQLKVSAKKLLLLLLLLLLHPFNGLFSKTTRVSRYQKGKTSLVLNEARDYGVLGCSGISWTTSKQSAPCTRRITTLTPHHSIFTGRMPFLTPNQQCQSTEGTASAKKLDWIITIERSSSLSRTKSKECHIHEECSEGYSSPFLMPWACRWINHWSLWLMASATSDL